VTQEQSPPAGPDLTHGVALTQFTDQKLLGHVGDREILLVQSEAGIFAVEAHCTHYHGPLAEGLVVGESIRCPWHHACFNLRSGEAEHAPATAPLASWRVEQEGELIFVRETRAPEKTARATQPFAPHNIVIVGGGAAGFAAAEMLRREGFAGSIVMFSSDTDAP